MGISSRKPLTVAVLLGGPSPECEVSLSSGQECAAALRDADCEVIEVDAGRDPTLRLQAINSDVVFSALHGRRGEDGCGQDQLEVMHIPHTHSDVDIAAGLAFVTSVPTTTSFPDLSKWMIEDASCDR